MTIGIDVRLWNQSGVGRYIRNLTKNLLILDKNNTYTLFALKKDYEIVNKQLAANKPENGSKVNWKIVIADVRWHTIAEQIKFLQILNKENMDLMHFPYISVPVFYKKPFITTVHDLIPFHFPTGKASTLPYPLYFAKRLAYKRVVKSALKNSAKIIVPLNAVKNDLINTLGVSTQKIVVTYEGADENISNPKAQISKNIQNSKYFLYVGNAYPHKNLEKLIKAFENIKDNDIKLILVGKIDYFYERLKNSTDSKNVIFYNQATDEELALLYKNCLALVQPSLMEGFGLPVLEAMTNKKLIVCSDIESLKELTRGNAIFFDPQSVSDIRKKLTLVIKGSPEFLKMEEKAYLRSKDFSWNKMAKETLKVYESI